MSLSYWSYPPLIMYFLFGYKIFNLAKEKKNYQVYHFAFFIWNQNLTIKCTILEICYEFFRITKFWVEFCIQGIVSEFFFFWNSDILTDKSIMTRFLLCWASRSTSFTPWDWEYNAVKSYMYWKCLQFIKMVTRHVKCSPLSHHYFDTVVYLSSSPCPRKT